MYCMYCILYVLYCVSVLYVMLLWHHNTIHTCGHLHDAYLFILNIPVDDIGMCPEFKNVYMPPSTHLTNRIEPVCVSLSNYCPQV